ncbi:MAG: hypothetical protein K8S27_08515 [Candidatus Omnitrophica bacterium]|nr:hypothetical protein [Candidatus Omnitrophota bacterium]
MFKRKKVLFCLLCFIIAVTTTNIILYSWEKDVQAQCTQLVPNGYLVVVQNGDGYTSPCCTTPYPPCPGSNPRSMGTWFSSQSGGSCGYCAYFRLCAQ